MHTFIYRCKAVVSTNKHKLLLDPQIIIIPFSCEHSISNITDTLQSNILKLVFVHLLTVSWSPPSCVAGSLFAFPSLAARQAFLSAVAFGRVRWGNFCFLPAWGFLDLFHRIALVLSLPAARACSDFCRAKRGQLKFGWANDNYKSSAAVFQCYHLSIFGFFRVRGLFPIKLLV